MSSSVSSTSNSTTSSSLSPRRPLLHHCHARSRQALTWSRVIPSPKSKLPPPRSGAASVVVGHKLYMFGGYGGGTGRLDDFYSFDFKDGNTVDGGNGYGSSGSNHNGAPCHGTWQEVEVLSKERPGCRENNGVVIGDSSKMYLFGGYNGTSWLNDLWCFDIDTARWTCLQENSDETTSTSSSSNNNRGQLGNNDTAAGGIVAGAGAGAGGGILASRRQINNNNNLHGNLLSNNHIGNNNNNSSTGTPPSRRFGYVSVVHDNKFVLFGGFDGTKWLNDMYEFNFTTKTWKCIQARGQLPSVRSCPAWAKDDHYVYIQGGYDGVERKADFFACDLSTYTWWEMPCLGTPPSPRYFHSCCLYGNKMYAYGGYSGSERLADMYAYDFETNHWSQVDCSNGTNNRSYGGGGGGNSVRYRSYASTRGGSEADAADNSSGGFIGGGDLNGTALAAAGGGGGGLVGGAEDVAALHHHHGGLVGHHHVSSFNHHHTTHHLSNLAAAGAGLPPLPSDVPSGRSSLVAQVYENCLYIFGGYNGVTVLNDFYKFRLKPVSIPPSALVNDMYTLMNCAEFADVTFIVDGEEMYANRAILAVRSEYFRAMFFRSGMREQSEDSGNGTISISSSSTPSTKIEMKDVSRDVFMKVLEFLYTDTVRDISYDIGIPLLIVSERFMLDRLKSLCEDSIRRDISFDNVISIYIASHRHHALGLKDIALEFILQYIHEPTINNGLVELKAEPDLLLEIIQRSSMMYHHRIGPSSAMMGSITGGGSGGGGNTSSSSSSSALAAAAAAAAAPPRGGGGGGGGNASSAASASLLIGGLHIGDGSASLAGSSRASSAGPFGSNSEWSGTRR